VHGSTGDLLGRRRKRASRFFFFGMNGTHLRCLSILNGRRVRARRNSTQAEESRARETTESQKKIAGRPSRYGRTARAPERSPGRKTKAPAVGCAGVGHRILIDGTGSWAHARAAPKQDLALDGNQSKGTTRIRPVLALETRSEGTNKKEIKPCHCS
jgi:hypothetical protein